MTALLAVAYADVSVGVKKGDWIEYQVKVIGNPPPRYNVTWASINVTSVQGENLGLYILTKFTNGSLLIENVTVNLVTRPGDSFVIPSGLNPGEAFYNQFLGGNVTISGVVHRTVLGEERTLVQGATNVTAYYWDRQTGILVQAKTVEPIGSNTGFGISKGFTVYTKAIGTNIWQPQILGLNLNVFYAIIVAAVVVVVALVAIATILIWRKRTHP
ncbi:MAG TPA: hypothetical protein VK536_03765 [Candidatus Limnocylindrales bacterium]|nr:hypothetical protein [Candidatus Limnocylindrales bacterium]